MTFSTLLSTPVVSLAQRGNHDKGIRPQRHQNQKIDERLSEFGQWRAHIIEYRGKLVSHESASSRRDRSD
jgi:hypothetical protein|tara:strand:- start:1379 stop:1588 length:210 start_codon:yes stop_codon:yes gene_type:complete